MKSLSNRHRRRLAWKEIVLRKEANSKKPCIRAAYIFNEMEMNRYCNIFGGPFFNQILLNNLQLLKRLNPGRVKFGSE